MKNSFLTVILSVLLSAGAAYFVVRSSAPALAADTDSGTQNTTTLRAVNLNLDDYPDIQHDYLREHMMKQYVLLYLDEGKYDVKVYGSAY